MKMKALTALWLCFAISFQLKAQNEKKVQDSIYIEPFAGCKVILTGGNMDDIIAKNRLEELKNKFIQDYKQSAKEKEFPGQAKNILYLVDKSGRRRLKAIPDENTQFDLKNEIKDFRNNLPPYHYTIYDFPAPFSYHIYVSDPSDLDELDTINCIKIFADIAAKRDKYKYNSIQINRLGTGFSVVNKERFFPDFLILDFSGGVSLINGSLAPTLTGNIDFGTSNHDHNKVFRAGLGYSFYTFGTLDNKSFSNIYPISSYDLHVLFNMHPESNKGNKWFGLSAGKFTSGPIFGGSYRSGSLDKAWKAGFVSEFGSFGFDYNFIFDKNKNTSTGITFKYFF